VDQIKSGRIKGTTILNNQSISSNASSFDLAFIAIFRHGKVGKPKKRARRGNKVDKAPDKVNCVVVVLG
jgi:hypothetical protein